VEGLGISQAVDILHNMWVGYNEWRLWLIDMLYDKSTNGTTKQEVNI